MANPRTAQSHRRRSLERTDMEPKSMYIWSLEEAFSSCSQVLALSRRQVPSDARHHARVSFNVLDP